MLCPECGESNNIVIDTHKYGDKVDRVRKCRSCGYPWCTEERIRETKSGVEVEKQP